ncbi:SDR family NAD(P)-dependent oxidoreductase [Nocardia blacklockiae]|uniref:SDR family NAD(P)-dependent oxidoreductase n=1 Tax=Nocardia blacklockiae TaxID=480036 RepID=UPI001895BBD2|nr:SDR family NAD(P)-dependent oxidoreductase [Nocardia blacklockiae]MBF6174829.1 SDR family NAD(P)-dependent oxidoreductase [Nocardia blacklockiae]
MRSVFITGATGGIGTPTVRLLAERGYRVFAGVRDVDKAKVFDGLDHVLPVVLDVTDEASVAEAAREVGRRLGGDTLDAVVNNAGIIIEGPVELVEETEWEREFRVNVFGPAAVIRSFLPLLRASRGRVVNVTAPTARLAVPYNAPISASKAALASLSVALRGELAAWGIKVVMVEPTGTETPIFALAAESADESRQRADPRVVELYAPMIDAIRASAARMPLEKPQAIASVLVKAITAKRPRTRYTAGRGAGLLSAVGRLPDPISDAVVARAIGIAGVGAR